MAGELTSIDPLRPLLSESPLGLVTDIDGTLAPIVDDPEAARVSPGCRRALEALAERGVRIVFSTGRPLDKARGMIDLVGAAYAANHGLSLWVDGAEETPEAVRPYVAVAREVLAQTTLSDIAGVLVENKGPVLAFHYRQAPDEGAAREAIVAALRSAPAAEAFRIHEGRKVIELRPPLPIDKGTAVAALVQRLGLRAVLCLGDDATDIDMFRAVRELRTRGLQGVTVAVRSEEASEGVLEAADYWVAGVPGVEWLLGELLRALPGTATSGP